ncbi:MAG: cyclic nucleotide-binding protein [Holophagaceae bacterium]|nr:cyclic nucleotide-binding protein [Holophagaceae bacterium]
MDLHRAWTAIRSGCSHAWVVIQETLSAFLRNDDWRQASSLAFYTSLAIIPALLLLTFVLGLGIGSSQKAMLRTTELVNELLPDFGGVILREVGAIARHKRGVGLANVLLLVWSLTPLVASFRSILNHIFKVRPSRPLWISKGVDLATSMVVILSAAILGSAGLALNFLNRLGVPLQPPLWLKTLAPYLLTVLLLLALYGAFAPRIKRLHLLAGALTTAFLWFFLKPTFTLFLLHNPGYGLAFGSFKSLFIIFIWIYYSMALLLLGAEVMAALNRKETLLLKRFLEGRAVPSRFGRHRFLLQVPQDQVFFREGEPGREMFYVLKGRVSIRCGEREIAVVEAGGFFGEMGFLLGLDRSATALALEPCECMLVHEQSMDVLMREFPDMVRDMLTEMALRLRAMDERLQGNP